jgi:hypothetical protein
MVFGIFEVVIGCFAIFVGYTYYGFGGLFWHVTGITMGCLSVPAFAAAGYIFLSK